MYIQLSVIMPADFVDPEGDLMYPHSSIKILCPSCFIAVVRFSIGLRKQYVEIHSIGESDNFRLLRAPANTMNIIRDNMHQHNGKIKWKVDHFTGIKELVEEMNLLKFSSGSNDHSRRSFFVVGQPRPSISAGVFHCCWTGGRALWANKLEPVFFTENQTHTHCL